MKLIPILVGCLVLANLSVAHADPVPSIPPPAPIGLKASFNNTTQELVLTWTMPEAHNASVFTFNVYRNGDQLASGSDRRYADATYGTFNLYWITAQDANGTSLPSAPISFITCADPVDCAPDAGLQAASWTSYSAVSFQGGFRACRIVAVQLQPFGYLIYWDCIWGIIHGLPVAFPCAIETYGRLIPPSLGLWCI